MKSGTPSADNITIGDTVEHRGVQFTVVDFDEEFLTVSLRGLGCELTMRREGFRKKKEQQNVKRN